VGGACKIKLRAGSRDARRASLPVAELDGRNGHEPIRILLADDHTVVRGRTARLLEHESDMTVVAEAADGREWHPVGGDGGSRCDRDGYRHAQHERHGGHAPGSRS